MIRSESRNASYTFWDHNIINNREVFPSVTTLIDIFISHWYMDCGKLPSPELLIKGIIVDAGRDWRFDIDVYFVVVGMKYKVVY